MIKRILIVDDEQTFRNGFARALNRVCDFQGEVTTCESGSEALHKIRNSLYDICFLDLNLPDANGLDIMNEIGELSPETKIVIMTGSYISGEMKARIDKGSSLYISKPVELETVKSFIQREMHHKRGPDADRQESNSHSNTERRQFARQNCAKKVHYSINIFYDWELKTDLVADMIDLSEGGAGIRTGFPLAARNILKFNDELGMRKGMVQWRTKEGRSYRAGIRFILA